MSEPEFHDVYSVSPLNEWDGLLMEFAGINGLFFQTTGGGPIGGYVLLTTVAPNPAENAGAIDYNAIFRVDKQGIDGSWVVEPLRSFTFGLFYQVWGQLCVSIKTESG